MTEVLVGLLDSGLDADLGEAVAASRRFVLLGGDVEAVPPEPDRHGHGSALARLILDEAPGVRLLNAQVFGARGVASPAAAAAGLFWLVDSGAWIVNMSLGLVEDRAILRKACAAATEAGVLLVASVPAVGPLVYPARYPGVVRVTGDARCLGGEVACVDDGRVDFGASPGLGHGPARISGASVAAARITAALAAAMAGESRPDAGKALARLAAAAAHRGPQREHLNPAVQAASGG